MTDYSNSRLDTRNHLARRWPWRRYRAIGTAYDVTNASREAATFDLLDAVRRDAQLALAATIAASRWPDVFPWNRALEFEDATSQFTRDIVVVGCKASRYEPCWPWQTGASWKGFRA